MIYLLLFTILLAVIYDYINGFHDCANSIATSVSTGVLKLRTAVLIAGLFNFIGAITGTSVAKTIATGFADPSVVSQYVILSALIGACLWNLITWWFGLPSSSSHALIGGLAGAVIANAGWHSFNFSSLYKKILIPLVLSPTIGFIISFLLMILFLWIFKPFKAKIGNIVSKKLQLLSSIVMSFSHGSNDAQKSMGIIMLALLAGKDLLPVWMVPQTSNIPGWVIFICALSMALGTIAGGKKIIKTMGSKIIKINPLQGFVAETSSALIILFASKFGIPISTTHCINATIMGVGASKKISAVRWGVAGNILIAWILTIPSSFLLSYILMFILKG